MLWYSTPSHPLQCQHPLQALVLVPAPVLHSLLPAKPPGKAAENDSKHWAPATHMGNSEEALSFWLWPRRAPAIEVIWGVNYHK